MHRYKDLEIWKKSLTLSFEIYRVTEKFPSEEKFGLTSQMRRSSVSIPSNIAVGAGRNSNGEFRQFLGIATGSLFELETQVLLSEKMNFLTSDESTSFQNEILSITNMIFKLKENLKS